MKNYIFIIALSALTVAIFMQYVRQLDFSPNLQVEDLPYNVKFWHQQGRFYEVYGKQMFTVTRESINSPCKTENSTKDCEDETIILVHGFPTSSFDYMRSIDVLWEKFDRSKRIVAFDHLGFGFSDKPYNYTYSLIDQADHALRLWQLMGIRSAHLVAHDMGDSIVTEILARQSRIAVYKTQIGHLQLKSITFTNGGMRLALARLRVSQYVMVSRWGKDVNEIISKLLSSQNALTKKQLASIWSPSYSDTAQMNTDIRDIIALNQYNGGFRITYKLISYLTDRWRFESRWYEALETTEVPIYLVWGNQDAVAPLDIALYIQRLLKKNTNQPAPSEKTLIQLDAGHFVMLEKPLKWAQTIYTVIQEHN